MVASRPNESDKFIDFLQSILLKFLELQISKQASEKEEVSLFTAISLVDLIDL